MIGKLYKIFLSVCRCLYFKMKYGSKLDIEGILNLGERFHLNISRSGKMIIGDRLVTFQDVSLASSGDMKIGSHCFMNSNVSINCFEKIYIGNNCEFGNNIVIVDHDHDYRISNKQFISSPISIGSNVWIGANSVILRGTTIGDNCVIAAGSTVRGSIPDNHIYYESKERNVKVINREKRNESIN